MNCTQIIGNLTGDPQLKDVGQTKVCEFSIAFNEVYYDTQKQKVEKVHYFNCQAWAGMGETIAKHFTKGQKIGVTGALKQDRWEKDGQKHSAVRIRVDGFDFCGGKPGEQTSGAPRSNAPAKDPDLDADDQDAIPF